MALIVEDGTGSNPLANSYVSEAEIITFASLRGVTMTNEQATIAGIAAMDWLFVKDSDLQGEPTHATQPLPYPKTGIIPGCGDSDPLPDNEIPPNIIQAQLFLALYNNQGVTLSEPVTGQTVKREKVDVIETEYATPAEGGATNVRPIMPTVDALLTPISVGCGVVSSIMTVRI